MSNKQFVSVRKPGWFGAVHLWYETCFCCCRGNESPILNAIKLRPLSFRGHDGQGHDGLLNPARFAPKR